MTRAESIIQAVTELLIRRVRPEAIYLFGSRAKKNNSPNADFDFAVTGDPPAKDVLRGLETDIEKAAGLYKVDVVFLNQVEPEFKKIVLQSGEALYVRNDLRN
jgi:predicted nucleotidyltransferase